MLAVPLLKAYGLDEHQAHATSIAVILPLSVVSGILYFMAGRMTLGEITPYLLPGAIGAVAGALLLRKLSPNLVRRIFGGLLVFSAVRMFMR